MTDLSQYKVSAPQPVTLQGRYVAVEPYDRAQHVDALWDALGGMEINPLLLYFPQNDFSGVAEFGDWLDRMAKVGWIPHIFRDRSDGAIVGMASYMRADPANGVVEVGAVAHGNRMRRSPLSTEAHFLMARHVFEDLGYRRYEWKCDNNNEPSKQTALRYGFTFEGVFRQHMIAKGRNRDTAWFSIIDSEWPSRRQAFEQWLDPANFGADGSQKQRLEEIRSAVAHEGGQ